MKPTRVYFGYVIFMLLLGMGWPCGSVAQQTESYYAVIIDSTDSLKDENGGELQSLSKHFGEAYDILEDNGEAVQINIDNQPGWVSKEAVLIKPKDPTQTIYALRVQGGKLDRKVVVVNQLKASDHPVRVPLYDNPKLAGKSISETTIFELRYLFAEFPQAVLVGKTDRLSKTTATEVLIGWIDKSKYIYEWNSRMGVEFDKETYNKKQRPLAGIFDQERDLEDFLTGDTRVSPLYEEDSDTKEMPYYANRFPVLDRKMLDKEKGQAIYHIVYIGGGYGKQKDIEIERRDIDEGKRQADQVIRNKQVRLAIVVDATKGMQPHIEAVKTALQKFITDLQENKDTIEVEIAVGTYRDYADDDKVYELKTAFTRDYPKVIENIGTITADSRPDDKGEGTYPEALFYGLTHTIDLDWGDDIVDKYMVLVGDHGNHEHKVQYPQDQPYTEESVKTKLEDKRIALYAVQVNLTAEKRRWNELFERQVRQIIGENNPFGDLQKVKLSSSDAIYKSLSNTYMTFMAVKDTVKLARLGATKVKSEKPTKKTKGPTLFKDIGYSGRFTRLILERYGIDPNVFNAVQVCAEGYVNKQTPTGVSQLTDKVLMTKEELEALKVQTTELATAIFRFAEDYEEQFTNTLKGVVKALAGDVPRRNETIADFIEKKAGIPLQTATLNKTVEELGELVKTSNTEERNVLVKYFRKRVVEMEGVLKEEELELGEWIKEEGTFAYDNTGRKREYFFSFEQPLIKRIKPEEREMLKAYQKTHVWVPLKFLP
ncbi:MAG: hypothetical protein BWK78_04145 [Thiotrichaceae bacterium IS1]|nr:MAG: hypothetical protein BWK78_04145 [Thiotrichaceae bacterium IS1]